MLQNAYLLAKIGADTAENEQHFAEILPTVALRPEGLPQLLAIGVARAVRRGRPLHADGRRRRPRTSAVSERNPGIVTVQSVRCIQLLLTKEFSIK